ncbi:hypothetical protein MNBD_ALPHA09-1251 [hydrothermal vent metagenome]|uniref:Peptidase S9 prolyl oligopeptidase catalytic domain-containing protein n=1 Tax=hydrothermal vent metagenome TaxID=652676 RepID=A0A3B0TF90_9ZZZZ
MTIRPYGTWPSPIAASDVASAGVRYGLCRYDGEALYWSELRPDSGPGAAPRSVIVACDTAGAIDDVLPPPFSARSRVHEYGGGEFAVHDGRVVFVNDADQDLYVIEPGAAPRQLTQSPGWRFADMTFAPDGTRILAVAERHEAGHAHQLPQNTIVSVELFTDAVREPDLVLAGRDFYASPRFSPNGSQLAWLAWDLPHMPWEAAELWVADIGEDGGIKTPRHIAGGGGAGAFQPEWSPRGELYFIADHDGWGNLHIADADGVRPLLVSDAEFGRPLWQFGMTSYAVLGNGRIAASSWRGGRLEVGLLEVETGNWSPLDTDLVRLDSISGSTGGFAIVGGTDTKPPGVLRFASDGAVVDQLSGGQSRLAAGDISVARALRFETDTGPLHGLFYPPANANIQGPDGQCPPLVVSAHGGPTAMARRGLDLERQYWTTRGFAFLDVDYRGSFGYGRAYVRALDGAWGVLDAADVVTAARAVAEQGLADAAAMVITGSSAGGLTVLNALASSDVFAAGASAYGVADLASLASDTHKFEAGYLFALMGVDGDDGDAWAKVFGERSPLTHASRIASPVIFLQGLDDAVVPPSQSEVMAASLRERGVPVAYLEFAGEGHGFRKTETVIAALEATHGFFARILGLAPADDLPPVKIDNFS